MTDDTLPPPLAGPVTWGLPAYDALRPSALAPGPIREDVIPRADVLTLLRCHAGHLLLDIVEGEFDLRFVSGAGQVVFLVALTRLVGLSGGEVANLVTSLYREAARSKGDGRA